MEQRWPSGAHVRVEELTRNSFSGWCELPNEKKRYFYDQLNRILHLQHGPHARQPSLHLSHIPSALKNSTGYRRNWFRRKVYLKFKISGWIIFVDYNFRDLSTLHNDLCRGQLGFVRIETNCGSSDHLCDVT